MINFPNVTEQYKHWKLKVAGLGCDADNGCSEDVTLAEGYKLKLNSYVSA